MLPPFITLATNLCSFPSNGTSKITRSIDFRSSPRSALCLYLLCIVYTACTYKAISRRSGLSRAINNQVSGLTSVSRPDFNLEGSNCCRDGQKRYVQCCPLSRVYYKTHMMHDFDIFCVYAIHLNVVLCWTSGPLEEHALLTTSSCV